MQSSSRHKQACQVPIVASDTKQNSDSVLFAVGCRQKDARQGQVLVCGDHTRQRMSFVMMITKHLLMSPAPPVDQSVQVIRTLNNTRSWNSRVCFIYESPWAADWSTGLSDCLHVGKDVGKGERLEALMHFPRARRCEPAARLPGSKLLISPHINKVKRQTLSHVAAR